MAGIDRDFWLEYAKKGVTNSVDSRDKAAAQLDNYLKWIWGIYTSVFALASLFDYLSNNISQIVLVAQPILVIIIARFFCTLVSMPSAVNADTNVVVEIIEGHIEIVAHKKKKLKRAKIATIISIISLSAALIAYNVLDPNRQIKSEIKQLKLEQEKVEGYLDPIQRIIDSLKQANSYYELHMQNKLMQEKYDCFLQNDIQCIDSLNALLYPQKKVNPPNK